MVRQHESGQAVIEWALLSFLFSLLLLGVATFALYFSIDQQLIRVAREGAMLYSSGRLKRQEVRYYMRRSLEKGRPAIAGDAVSIYVGRRPGKQSKIYELDLITVTYRLNPFLARFFKKEMTEQCTIKHAPPYKTLDITPLGPAVPLNPPVPW